MTERILADRYQLTGDRHVGRQGTILQALDTQLGRQVAIKLGGSGADEDAAARRATLVREAKYLARFHHPNIVTLFDFFQLRDAVGFVMPYLRANLAQRAGGRRDLDLAATVAALRNVAQALDFCAEHGVAHRDVKPANILMAADASALLCDFGIAAEFGSEQHWGGIVGTEPFIPPECFLGSHDDKRRVEASRRRYDQFGLGVTIYQILTRRIPFGDGAAAADRKASCTALQLIKRKSYPPCHLINETLPRTVDDVVARMLAVDPEDRYPSNVEAIAALDSAMAGHAGGPRRLFISYSHADRPLAAELARHLAESHGLEVWWDRALVAGVDWGDQIEQAMEASDLMIVLISPHSAYSSEVKLEWRYWLDALRRPLVSLVLADCRIPYRLFSHQHLVMGENTGSDLATVAADIATLIPKVFAAFQASARRTAQLRPAAAAPIRDAPGTDAPTLVGGPFAEPPTLVGGPLAEPPTLVAAPRHLDQPRTLVSGASTEPAPASDDTLFATAVRGGLDDFQTAALVLDRRHLADFATQVGPQPKP